MGRDLIHFHDISDFGPHIHIIYVFLIDRLPSGPLISEAFMRRHISHLCFNAMSVWFSNFKTGDERIRCCWIHGKLESVASLNWTRLQSWHVTRLTLDKQYKRISPTKVKYNRHLFIAYHDIKSQSKCPYHLSTHKNLLPLYTFPISRLCCPLSTFDRMDAV